MERFWTLYERNAIISGALALILVCAVVFLACTGRPIPELLGVLAGAACGYFFGAGKAADVRAVVKGEVG